jgi:hypothetical protein
MKETDPEIHSEGIILDPDQSSASPDGIDRRGFLKCMAWAGTGVMWSLVGGVPVSRAFGSTMHRRKQEDFTFVQISDSHIGFNKPANADVTGTLQTAVDKILSIPSTPDFLISHRRFDTLVQARRIRHDGSSADRCQAASILCSGRA